MKVWSTTQIAGRLAAALGKHVTDAFVRDCYLEMHGLEHMGSGHVIRITEAEAKLIIAYGIEWHGRPSAPAITESAAKRGQEIPKLRKALLPVPAKPKIRKAVAGTATMDRDTVARLAEDVHELKRIVAELRRRAPVSEKTKQLTDGKTWVINFNSQRQRIAKLVRGWARDRTGTVSYETVWSEVYRTFWSLLGEQPPEWISSQLVNEYKLDFFEQYGYLGLLVDALPSILTMLSHRFPINPKQGELGV